MADGLFPTLVSKDRNANAVANPVFVTLSDGSAAISVTGTSLDVNVTNATVTVDGTITTNYEYASDVAYQANDVGAAILAVRNDTLASLVGSDGDYAPLQVDALGALYVNAAITVPYSYVDDTGFTVESDEVAAIGCLADETSPDSVTEGDVGIPRMTLDRKQLMVIVDKTTDTQRLAITANGEAKVDISAQSLTAVKISKDSSANTETNPIFVKVVDTVVSGEEVCDWDTTVNLASDTPDNHDLPVAGAVFFLKSVIASSSGGMKFTVQTGPVASLVTKAVGFIPKHGGTEQIFFDPAIEVPVASTGTIRVIRYNREGSAQDVYSSIIGNDV